MIYKILLPLIFSFNLFAIDKDFKTVNDRVPLEFNLLFESMKISTKKPAEKISFIGICRDLDENLGFLGKEHIFLLMKSEVIKNVLEYKHQKVRQFDITSSLIIRLKEEFSKKNQLLTPFAQWIWRSILAELTYRETMGLITDKSFNISNFTGAKLNDAQRFSRYLNYILPWIDKMDSLEPAQFNDLTKEISWLILRRLNERSLLLKRFASTSETGTKITIFNIPPKLLDLRFDEIKQMQNDEPSLTLQEKSQKEKFEASKQVEGVIPDDLSTLSDELSKELDKKTP